MLASITYPLVTAAVSMVSATFSPLLGAAVGVAAAEYVQLGPLPAYGLCGGASLEERIAEAEDTDNPRATAALRAALARVNSRLAPLRDRRLVLGCP